MIATLFGALRSALGAISRNKLRAVLTVLGVFIGITAVVVVMAAGTSTTATMGAKSTAWRRTLSLSSRSPFRPPAPGAKSWAD